MDSEPVVTGPDFIIIGRIPGRWYATFDKQIVHGDTIGTIIGRVTDWLHVLTHRIHFAELEPPIPGPQAPRLPTDQVEVTKLDHFLEYPAGKRLVGWIDAVFGDSDPTEGTENTFEGDRTRDFYEGMSTGLAAAFRSVCMLEDQLHGQIDTRALSLIRAVVIRFVAGSLRFLPKEEGEGR
jgi:hypothetical protein